MARARETLSLLARFTSREHEDGHDRPTLPSILLVPIEDAIRLMQDHNVPFFTIRRGSKGEPEDVPVVVVHPEGGEPHLRSAPDDVERDNLLSLPDFP